MTSQIESSGPSGTERVVAWTALGFVLYVVLGFGSVLLVAWFEQIVLEPIGLGGEPGTSSWGFVLAMHPIVWGVLTAAIAAWVGQRWLEGAVRPGLASAAYLVLGLVLAAITMYLLHEFVRARYFWFDPEYAGFALFAPPALVALGLAGWAAASLERARRRPLVVIQIAALAGLAIALLPSLPGIADGIQAPNIPLAAVFVIDAGFALASVIASVLPGRTPAAAGG